MKNSNGTTEALNSLKTNLGVFLRTKILSNQISIVESQEISTYFLDNFTNQMTPSEIVGQLTKMKTQFPSIVEVIV